MTVRTTALVLASVLVAGAAAIGAVTAGMTLSTPDGPRANRASADKRLAVMSNFDAKGDRLAAVLSAARLPDDLASPADILRTSFDSIATPETGKSDKAASRPPAPVATPEQPLSAKLKLGRHVHPLLNDAQIASIRQRLKLTPAQESYWPGIVAALHEVIRLHDARKKAARGGAVTLDPEAPEVQRLKAAAAPLLMQLRPDQKNEVRMLARIIGLESAIAAL